MRIGVFTELNRLSGGVYQYGVTMLHALREMKDGAGDDYVLFSYPKADGAAACSLGKSGWRIEPLLPPTLGRRTFAALSGALGEARSRRALGWLRERVRRASTNGGADAASDPYVARQRPEVGRWLRHCGAQLMIYPAASSLSFETGVPSVMAVHDLQHRLQPEFPEVSAGGEWERREYVYRNAARYATLLVTDSEVGREDVLNLYGEHGATPDRVKVLPFRPAHYLTAEIVDADRRRVRATHKLPERYLFYPAQFWPHKNHTRIVRALGLLKRECGLDVHVVFCGSHAGDIREAALREVASLSRQLGLEGRIHRLGYVPDEDVSALYAEAVALVMPTFFGPTNIPVLEAWATGCPVLTSDIRGVREQAGDAAVLVDPRSDESIAEGIQRLWTDEGLRGALAGRGRRRLAAYGDGDYGRRLRGIIEEAKEAARSGRGAPEARGRVAARGAF